MEMKTVIQQSIEIDAPPSTVWQVLTDPRFTKEYLFGCEVISDWTAGSPVFWKGKSGEQSVIRVKGHIVQIEPGTYWAYTTFSPSIGLRDEFSNYKLAAYELSPTPDGTILTVTQGDCVSFSCSTQYKDHPENGWDSILLRIKELAEAA